MLSFRRLSVALVVCLHGILSAPFASALAAGSPADLLPAEAFLVAEVPRGAKAVDALLDSRAWRALLASDALASFRTGPDYLKLAAGLAMLNASCGVDAAGAARALLGKEAAFALVPAGAEVGLVAAAEIDDAIAAESVLAGLEALASASAKGATAAPAVAHARGEIRAVGPNLFRSLTATHLVVGSSADLVAAALDRTGSVARRAVWLPAPASNASDVEIAYRHAAAPKKVPERLADLGQALLLGGFAEAIRSAPVVLASLDLDVAGAGPALTLRAPSGASAAGAYFPEKSAVSSLGLPNPPRSLGAFRMRRDLAALWDVRETLLDTSAISGLAQFAGFMAILFSGRDFGEDVLPKFLPDVEIVAARPEFAPGEPRPKVPVPAFGAVFRLRDAAGFGPFLEVAFQTALGVVNADRGQKGMMPMLIRTETHRGASVVSGRFVASSSGDPEDAQWNYSPAAAIANDRFILASSAAFCRDLVDDVREAIPLSSGLSAAQDQVVVHGPSLVAYLASIEETMVAQNRLEKGNDEAAARREIATLLGLLRLVDRLEIVSRVEKGGEVRVDARLAIAAPAPVKANAGAR